MKVQVLKLKIVNCKSEFSWLIDDSNNYVMYCYVCRKGGQDIAGKTEFVTGKKLKRESPVYHNKTKNLKHEKCFNVVSQKKIIPHL